MLTTSNLGSRFAAAVSALAITLVMIGGTVSVPSDANARSSAYVSVVA